MLVAPELESVASAFFIIARKVKFLDAFFLKKEKGLLIDRLKVLLLGKRRNKKLNSLNKNLCPRKKDW